MGLLLREHRLFPTHRIILNLQEGTHAMRDVAIISYSQFCWRDAGARNEVEMILPTITAAKEMAGVSKDEIDFTCSGSCDYLTGAAFSFVAGVDPLGAVPPIQESHLETDAAWAL